jgi:hypothetical protein
MSNGQLRRADNGGFPSWGLSGGLTTSHRKNINMLRNVTLGLQRMLQNLTYNVVYYTCRTWYRAVRPITERDDVAVMLQTRIWDVLSSNLGRDTSDPDFSQFSSNLPRKCRIVLRLGHDCFLSNPFLVILLFDAT